MAGPITTASREVEFVLLFVALRLKSTFGGSPQRVEKSTFGGPYYHSESRSRLLAAPITTASREVELCCLFVFVVLLFVCVVVVVVFHS